MDGEKFAHCSNDGDFWSFAGAAQAGVKGFEKGVGANCNEGGHIEHAAGIGASACDLAAPARGALALGLLPRPVRAQAWRRLRQNRRR